MCGLAINIASFAHLLKKVDCDAIVGSRSFGISPHSKK